MTKEQLSKEYFTWLLDLIYTGRYAPSTSYMKLLIKLHEVEFVPILRRDGNRAMDGVCLRRRFAFQEGYEEQIDIVEQTLDGPCSMLEMIVALAIRCEETIMDDPRVGDRTRQWFWGMLSSMGLKPMVDIYYDEDQVDAIINRFISREYQSNGVGGLFTIRNSPEDLRKVEIWCQMCWYLDTLS